MHLEFLIRGSHIRTTVDIEGKDWIQTNSSPFNKLALWHFLLVSKLLG